MPELKIERDHTLGLAGARAVAQRWREQAEQEWGMACEHETGEAVSVDGHAGEPQDQMRFSRSGISGLLTVTENRFDLQLKLGFLLGAYSERIAQKINANLDELLGPAQA
jgi:putative polyhydroxyalkanoate system protein